MIFLLLLACEAPLPASALPPPQPLRWWSPVDRPAEGGTLLAQVDGGVPGETVWLLGSVEGASPGATCPPWLGGCVDLIRPQLLQAARMPTGHRNLSLDLPPTLPAGTPIWLQAVQRARGLRVTPVAVTRVVAPCVADAAEPDDLTTLHDGDRLTGRTACGDEDRFLIPARRGDRVELLARYDVDDDSLTLLVDSPIYRRIYGPGEVGVEVLMPADGDLVASLDVLSSSTERGATLGVPYELEVTLTPSGLPPCAEDPWEGGPAPLTFDQPTSGVLCDGDREDSLSFPVVQGTWYELELSWDPADTSLRAPSFATDVGAYTSGQIYAPQVEPGRAIVRFPAEITGTLTTVVQLGDPDLQRLSHPWTAVVREGLPLEACVDDALEPNDLAHPAPAPGAWTGLALCPNSPTDVFQVTSAGPAVLDVRAALAEGDARARVYDAQGRLYACGDGCPLPLHVGLPSAGSWLVEVELTGVLERPVDTHWSPYEHGVAWGTAYDLDIQLSAPPACPADPFAPNAAPFTGPALSPGVTTGHVLCDNAEVDHFRVWLQAGEELIVDAGRTPTWLSLQVTGPGGEQLVPGGRPADPTTRVIAWQDGWHDLALSLRDVRSWLGWISEPVPYEIELRVGP